MYAKLYYTLAVLMLTAGSIFAADDMSKARAWVRTNYSLNNPRNMEHLAHLHHEQRSKLATYNECQQQNGDKRGCASYWYTYMEGQSVFHNEYQKLCNKEQIYKDRINQAQAVGIVGGAWSLFNLSLYFRAHQRHKHTMELRDEARQATLNKVREHKRKKATLIGNNLEELMNVDRDTAVGLAKIIGTQASDDASEMQRKINSDRDKADWDHDASDCYMFNEGKEHGKKAILNAVVGLVVGGAGDLTHHVYFGSGSYAFLGSTLPALSLTCYAGMCARDAWQESTKHWKLPTRQEKVQAEKMLQGF